MVSGGARRRMVGIAFGVNEAKQHIGDVLVIEHLRLYDIQRVGTGDDGEARLVLRTRPWCACSNGTVRTTGGTTS